MTRSTKLKYYLELCPHAVTLYEQGSQHDLSLYARGTAAHDILHALALHPHEDYDTVARHTCQKLIETGRSGYDSEGPLSPDAVFAGRDIVMRWIDWGNDPRIDGALYEHGMGFRDDWSLTDYEHGWFRVRPDVMYPCSADDGEFGQGICVRDYKTSWTADASWLNSIQARCQAVAGWSWSLEQGGMSPSFIRREVVNLQTRRSFYEDVWLDAEGIAQLKRWRADIGTVINALDGMGLAGQDHAERRQPRTGKHCYRCPYRRWCKRMNEVGENVELTTLASDLIAHETSLEDIKGLLKEATAETPVDIGNNNYVGWHEKRQQEPVEDIADLVWRAWAGDQETAPTPSLVRGLLRASGIGMKQIRSIAKTLYPSKEDKSSREMMVSRMSRPSIRRRFGVFRGKA